MSTFRNEAVEFIYYRIKHDSYRESQGSGGTLGSQHNRYDLNTLITILTLLNEASQPEGYLEIRTTDISKGASKPEWIKYEKFCDKVKSKTGKGTPDAMRKNFFVDFHRMGFINRYDKDLKLIEPYERANIKYVSISKLGLDIINAKSLIEQYSIFSRGLDVLLGGYISVLLELFTYQEYNLKDYIDFYEYMFFVSAIDAGEGNEFSRTIDEAVELIQQWRLLTKGETEWIIKDLKNIMDPKNYKGDKTDKRDFHNRKNEIDQIFKLLDQSVYFEVINYGVGKEKRLSLRTSKIDGEEFSLKNVKRSKLEKDKYFEEHGIGKSKGFELHHVVPLSWSTNLQEFKLYDDRKNMIYIDAFSHAKVTQKGNDYVKLSRKGNEIYLSNFANSSQTLIKDETIKFDNKNRGIMKNYNDDLLKK